MRSKTRALDAYPFRPRIAPVVNTTPTLTAEAHFWDEGWKHVAGVDEAGRGAWAGPVCAAAVILPANRHTACHLAGVRDSKLLPAAQRERWCTRIRETALAVGVGWATPTEVDTLGIVPATRLAMQRAIAALPLHPNALLIDALPLPDLALPQRAFPRADRLALSVAAASIVAKVHRDRWMIEVADTTYPAYGFARHKGYGTSAHRWALTLYGPSPLHRLSFRPVAQRQPHLALPTGEVTPCTSS